MGGTDESISVCDVDETQRSLTTVIRTTKHQIVLHISIPPTYPDGVIPNFQFGKGTTLDANGKLKMTKVFHYYQVLVKSKPLLLHTSGKFFRF